MALRKTCALLQIPDHAAKRGEWQELRKGLPTETASVLSPPPFKTTVKVPVNETI